MEYLPNGFCLELCPGGFPLSTDSIILADFVKLKRNARVLDLGSGCGTLGLLLCASDETCTVTGLELDENAHNQALENIRANALASRLYSICADLRAMPGEIPRQSFDCCVSNPPYFSGGAISQKAPMARQEISCSLSDLFAAANYALRYGGDFYLVHKPEKLAQLISCGAAWGLEAKQLMLLRHKEGGPITLILLQLRKGGKPGLQLHERWLFDSRGEPTDYFREVYHI